MNSNVKQEIEKYWEERESLNFSDPDIKKNIFSVLQLLDSGEIRVCEKKNDNWIFVVVLKNRRQKGRPESPKWNPKAIQS